MILITERQCQNFVNPDPDSLRYLAFVDIFAFLGE